jgi:hypothetical protein
MFLHTLTSYKDLHALLPTRTNQPIVPSRNHLGVYHALCVSLWVTESSDVLPLSQGNLLRGAVTDEHGLATPLHSHGLGVKT